ncbi:FlgD immunoglobulin-like domain containing protein [Streptomyces sp. NPDC006464]|uniref:FlgD immunoglobulin-like domain containing protein n=1 Tax=Streptomyces sp. NPDC006464 TaxID=3154305 RepID=UPI0033A3141A
MRTILNSRRGRAAAAATATAAVFLTLMPLEGGKAAAVEPPAEVVVPAELTLDPYAGSLPIIGSTGFVQGGTPGGYRWFSFADGTITQVPHGHPVGTGTDLIASLTSPGARLWDPTTQSVQNISAPVGQQPQTMMGQSLVTKEVAKPWVWHRLSLDQGQVTDRVLTLPEGAEVLTVFTGVQGNPYGFWLTCRLNGVTTVVRVDRDFTARTVDLGPAATGGASVTADRYWFRFPVTGRLQIWDLAGDLFAPLHELDWDGGTPAALLGDQILARVPGEGGDRLVARPLAGGAEREVIDRITGDTRAGTGRVIAARSGSGDERTVYSVRAGQSGGAPVVERVAEVPLVATWVGRMSMAQGVLMSQESMPYSKSRVRERVVTTAGELAVGPKRELVGDGVCGPQVQCQGIRTGDGRAVFSGAGEYPQVVEAGQSLPGRSLTGIPRHPEWSRQASGRYISYLTSDYQTQVADLDTQQVVLRRPSGGSGQVVSLVGDTLWQESTRVGVVEAFDVQTGAWKWSRTVSDCDLTELQVWGAHLYWRCGDGKAGVQAWNSAVDLPVPAHDRAMLGDGYLAHSKGGVLSVTPLREEGATRPIGNPAYTDDYWTVDRFGGAIAYSDKEQAIHIVPAGVPASALSVLDHDLAQVLDLAAAPSWTGRWWLNKPAGSWTLTVKDRAGAVVRTLSGGEARGLVKAVWDGRSQDGAVLGDGRYTWELAAAPADGVGPALRQDGEVFLTHGALGTYEPVAPARILSTVSGVGATRAKVGPGGTVTLQVTGRGGVATTGVTAVTMNVTATNPTAQTYVTVYPDGTTRPATSSLNVAAGRTAPNLVTVPVGKDGKVTLYNHAGSVDLLADVAGYYTLSGAGDRFEAVAPARVLSTLGGVGAPKATVGAGKTVTVNVAGRGGLPATGVTAVTVNVTATNPTATTFVSAYPYGAARPVTSNLNVTAGQTVANLVTVPVKDGKFTLYNHSGAVDLLADVAGYFTDAAERGDRFAALAPARVLNTLSGTGAPKGKVGAGKSVDLQVAGQGGVPATGVSAIVMNVTVTNPTASTYVSVYPYGAPRPTTSNLNVTGGRTVANQVVVPVRDGKVTLYNHSGAVDLLADVAGYYTE